MQRTSKTKLFGQHIKEKSLQNIPSTVSIDDMCNVGIKSEYNSRKHHGEWNRICIITRFYILGQSDGSSGSNEKKSMCWILQTPTLHLQLQHIIAYQVGTQNAIQDDLPLQCIELWLSNRDKLRCIWKTDDVESFKKQWNRFHIQQ